MRDAADLFDVVIVGAGAAGLQTAARILESNRCLRVLVLERSSVSGGRIRDVQLAEGVEMAGLGAWKVDGAARMTHELLERHGIAEEAWETDVRRVEANGVCVGSLSDLRTRAFPLIPAASDLASIAPDDVPKFLQRLFVPLAQKAAQEISPLPTRLVDVVRTALDVPSEQFLRTLSHGYKALADYDIDIVGSLGSAKAGAGVSRPPGGMSRVTQVLERECTKNGAQLQHCALVTRLDRLQPHLYEVSYVRTRGRVLPGSDSAGARDIDTSEPEPHSVRARAVVLAIPPRAISRLTAHTKTKLLMNLCAQPEFRSCFGVPAFRAVALYARAWWDDDALGLPPLGARGTLLTNSSLLSMLMSYAGRGPNGEAALHLSYCNDFNARMDGGFWSEAVEDALGHAVESTGCAHDRDRHPAVDKAMYAHVRSELAKAFPLSVENIPEPLRFEWHYWDDGAVHVQIPEPGRPSISRREVEDWAVGGPVSLCGEDGEWNQECVVLAGEGFSEDWGWVEGALRSGARAADTVIKWLEAEGRGTKHPRENGVNGESVRT